MVWMDYSLIYKVILLTSLWNTVGFFGSKTLSICFSKFRVADKRWSFITTNLLRCSGYIFCSVVLALNLATVSRVNFWKILLNPEFHSASVLTEYNENFLLVEDIFVFVLSFFLTHLHEVISLSNIKSSELRRSILLTLFFLSGYCCKFLGVIFLVGAISSVSLAFQSAGRLFYSNKKSRISVIHVVKNLPMILLFVIWMYLYGYLIPIYCLYPVMLKDTTSVENRFCFNVFKGSFACYYFAEIFNSIFVQNIYSFLKKFMKSFAKLFKAVRRQYSNSPSNSKSQLDEKEETIKMYTGQSKSFQEIKRQMELMQMVKCVVAIRKKLKRAKENKEKLQSKHEKNETH